MINCTIIDNEIKELEINRYKLIKKFVSLVNIDNINYDLHGDRLNNKLMKLLEDINSLGLELSVLYRIKDKNL